MRRRLQLSAGLLAVFAVSVNAQEAPVLAVDPEEVYSLPIQMALEPNNFHQSLVTPTGQLRMGFAQMSIGGRGWPMTVALGYYPYAQNTGFGPGFGSSITVRLERDTNTGTLLIYEEDGSTSAYARLTEGTYQAVSGQVDARVFVFADGAYERIYADGAREIFDDAGRLTARRADNGFGYDLNYDDAGRLSTISHPDGQRIDVSWNGDRIASVSNATLGTIRYFYHSGKLFQMIDELGRETTFEYEGDTLSSTVLVDGENLAVSYDDNGLVAALTGPGAMATAFSHWNDPLGQRTVQTATDAAGYAYRLEIGVDPISPDIQQVMSIDPAGNATLREIVDGQTDVSINGTWIGGTISDDAGRPTAYLTPSGMVQLPTDVGDNTLGSLPNALGFPQHVTDGINAAWLSHDDVGRVIARAANDGVIERYEYDAGGRLVQMLRGDSWISTYHYDAADRLIRRDDSDGGFESIAYSPEGWLVEITSDDGLSMTIDYGPAGRVKSFVQDGIAWSVSYSDAGLPSVMQAADGREMEVSYDDLGRLFAFRNEQGLVTLLPDGPLAPIADSVGRLRGDVIIEGESAQIIDGGALQFYRLAENGDTITTTEFPDGGLLIERRAPDGSLVSADSHGSRPAIMRTNDDGQVIAMGDPSAPVQLEYDDRDLLSRRISPQGVVTELIHDEDGNLVSVASPLDRLDIKLNDAGQPLGMTLGDGTIVTQELDTEGRPIRRVMTDPLGGVFEETVTYDRNGNVTGAQSGNAIWAVEETPTTRKTTMIAGPYVQIWEESTDPATGDVTLTGPDGGVTVMTFDGAGRLLTSRSPTTSVNWELDPEGIPLAATIDGYRRVLAGESIAGTSVLSDTIYETDTDEEVARVLRLSDLRDQVWEMRFNGLGNLISMIDPARGETSYIYDAFENITARIDPEGRTFYAETDDLGREIAVGVAGGWAMARGYDGAVNGAVTYSGGTTLQVRLGDDTGTVVSEVNGTLATTTFHNEHGRFERAEDALGRVSVAHDEGGLIASETGVFGQTVVLARDTIGRLIALGLPDGRRITYAYEGNAIVQTGPTGESRRVSYDPETSTYSVELGESATAEVNLSAGHLLSGLTVNVEGESVSYAVERDAEGGVLAILRGDVRQNIGRDVIGRVTTTGRGVLSYDGSGNILTAPEGSREYDIAFRQVGGPSEAEYDADGRQIRAVDVRYSYDPVGRLIGVSSPDGPEISLRYDALGRLVERQTGGDVERYLWQGDLLIGVTDGAGEMLAVIEHNALYTGLVTLHLADGPIDLVMDQVGTPTVVVAEGTAELLDLWDIWGAPKGALPEWSRWIGFAGKPSLPAYGLSLFEHRAYAAADRRFLTPDPMGIAGSDNPYGFAQLDPVTFADVLGLNPVVPSIGPSGLSPSSLPFGPPTGALDFPSWTSPTHLQVEVELRRIANGAPSPAQRVAQETLDALQSPGIRYQVNERVFGDGRLFGSAGGTPDAPTFRMNAENIRQYSRRASGGVRHAANELRAIIGVYVHEASHILQRRLHQPDQIGRVWREVEAQLRQGIFDPHTGGFGLSHQDPYRAARRSARYALNTQYRSYLPSDHPRANSGYMANRGGIRQMNAGHFADLARQYMPNADRQSLMDIFREERSAAFDRHRTMLTEHDIRSQQPSEGVRRSRPSPTIESARSSRPTLDSTRVNRPRVGGPRGVDVEPPRVRRGDRVPLDRAGSTRPGLDANRGPAIDNAGRARPTVDAPTRARPRVDPGLTLRPAGAPDAPSARAAVDAPNARAPAADPPRDLRRNRVPIDAARGNRPTLNSARTARTPLQRTGPRLHGDAFEARATADQPRPRTTADTPRPNRGARAPRPATPEATRPASGQRPATAGTRPAPKPQPPEPRRAPPRPNADPPRSGGADGPRAPTPDGPRIPTPDATRTPAPDGPRTPVPDAPRTPVPDSPRSPAPDGPRTPAPDGPRTTTPDAPRPADPPGRPPRTGGPTSPDLSSGGSTRPPHVNSPDGVRLPHGPGGGGRIRMPSLGGALNGGFILWDVYSTVVDTDRYWRGEIGHQEYWTNIALNIGGNFAPWPINGAIMAHQLGKFAGTWAASKVLEAYQKGDPLARALVNWMRRNGWINANDPTFVALPERPPGQFGRGREIDLRMGEAVVVPFSLWAPVDALATLIVQDQSGEELARSDAVLFRGLSHLEVAPELIATLPAGRASVLIDAGDGRGARLLLTLNVRDVQETDVVEPEVVSGASLRASLEATRLDPTNLPWTRFDRPDAILDGPEIAGQQVGDWEWQDTLELWTDQVHVSSPGSRPLHYVLFDGQQFVAPGENIVQYLWIDPQEQPAQILIQAYDEDLSGAHRVNFGADLLAVDGRMGEAFVQAGNVPNGGQWWRLRIPVDDIGMGGRELTGIGFAAVDGRVLWGPTRLSGAEDRAPLLVAEDVRDTGGAPQADLAIVLEVAESGVAEVLIALPDGGELPLFSGPVFAGSRVFWWQGSADLLRGATTVARITSQDAETIELETPVPNDSGLVAEILFPPEGAVVRQTVPIFGQAGGAEFAGYKVEYRARGTGEEGWLLLTESNRPSLVTQAEIDTRIATILSQELRSTVYGNLASIETGSALHNFEFAPEVPVLNSGWIQVRLTVTNEAGASRSDMRSMRVGEVADGQTETRIASPDGGVTLVVPPLSLPAGMGALSIDLAADLSHGTAPEPVGAVYEMAPSGLEMAAPVALGFDVVDETEDVSVVAIGRDGAWRTIAGSVSDSQLNVFVDRIETGTRYYLAAVPADEVADAVRSNAVPWFEGALDSARGIDGEISGAALIEGPIQISGPTVLQIAHTAESWDGLALVLRSGTSARVLPLGAEDLSLSAELAAKPAGLEADGTRRVAVLRLDGIFAGEVTVDRVDLVRITSAAWRTFVARPMEGREIGLRSAVAGPLPSGDRRYIGPDGASLASTEVGGAEGALRDGSYDLSFTDGDDIVRTFGLVVDGIAPVVLPISPEPDETSPALQAQFALRDEGVGWDSGSLEMLLNGDPIPADFVQIASDGNVTVRFGEMLALLSISPGDALTIQAIVSDKFGNASQPTSWSWTYRPEAIAIGGARQLTLDGGAFASWTPDADKLTYLGTGGVQPVYRQLTLSSGEEVALDVPFVPAGALASGPDGRMAAHDDAGELHLGDVNGWTATGMAGLDPVFDSDGTIIFAQESAIMRLGDPTSDPEVLCSVPTGARVARPAPFGGLIVFTQIIYHQTLWSCDPKTGAIALVSQNADDPGLRDVDAIGLGRDLLYARDAGRSGLLRLDLGSGGETTILPSSFVATSRRPAMSPNGTTLIFESDASGRTEIWAVDLLAGFSFSVSQTVFSSAEAQELSLVITQAGSEAIASAQLLAADGTVLAEETEIDAAAPVMTVPAGAPDGEAQVAITLANGLVLTQAVRIDSAAPELQLRDPGTGEEIDQATLAVAQDFVIGADDESATRVVLRVPGQDDTALAGQVRFADLPDGAVIVVTDAAGNSTELRVADVAESPLAAESAEAGGVELPDTGAPDDQPAADGVEDGDNLAVLSLFLFLVFAAGGYFLWQHRRGT
ncbi:MAG: RHS repeat-associated core domain-containing protein [Yoonia sp.]|uniref:RHS repeat-associated core domain-containing protein n=1 Tax=Yoonia sp. TaxID=2212373 RepID=UPI003EF8F130